MNRGDTSIKYKVIKACMNQATIEQSMNWAHLDQMILYFFKPGYGKLTYANIMIYDM